MVLIHVAHTELVNPVGATPVLNQEQVWTGLARKARHPEEFVPVVESCEVLSEANDLISAVVHFKAGLDLGHSTSIKETCRLSPPCRIDYEMEDGSTATNLISQGSVGGRESGASELFLTFVFAWAHPEIEAGSVEAKTAEDNHKEIAAKAVKNTVAVIRKMAASSGS